MNVRIQCLGLSLLLAVMIAPAAQAQVSVGILIDGGGAMDRLMDKANEGVEVLLDELDDDCSRELVRQSSHVLVYGVGMPSSRDGGAAGALAGEARSGSAGTVPGGTRNSRQGDFDAAIAAERALKSFADATGAGYGVKPQVGNRLSRYTVEDIFQQIAGHLKQ